MKLYSFLLASTVVSALPSSQVKTVDVAIVGGGLSGLSAAKKLLDGGKTVLVLEARDRVGGKILNVKLANGGVTEVGAEFVGPTQDKVLEYISDLGLQTYKTYDNGSSVFWNSNHRSLYVPDAASGGLPPVQQDVLAEVGAAIQTLDAWAASLNVSAPWDHPNATAWDSLTLKDWVSQNAPGSTADLIFTLFSKSIFAAESSELSLLYVLAYIASAGDTNNKGTIERLLGVTNGAQERRVEGGTQLIPLTLASKIGYQHISLNSPVQCITKTPQGYEITAKGLTVHATKVVLALAPPLVKDIKFSPALPSARTQLNEGLRMGNIGKAIAIYDTPFWRSTDNLSGQALSDTGVTKVTFDNTPETPTYGAIMGFVVGDDMRQLDSASSDTIKAKALSDYARYFGSQAADAKEVVVQRWDLEEFSKGGPVAVAPVGVLSKYGKALREPIDGLHWAGTETAEFWTGYMDGAIRSGERVAKEILAL